MYCIQNKNKITILKKKCYVPLDEGSRRHQRSCQCPSVFETLDLKFYLFIYFIYVSVIALAIPFE